MPNREPRCPASEHDFRFAGNFYDEGEHLHDESYLIVQCFKCGVVGIGHSPEGLHKFFGHWYITLNADGSVSDARREP